MSSPLSLISRSALLATLLLANGCAEQGAVAPPVADLQAVVEPKPVPTDEIATSQRAADDYSASVEAWGDRISSAGARLCRWSKSVYHMKMECPK